MGGTWWSEDLAGEAVLQLDCLAVDDHLLRPGGRPVAGAAVRHVCGHERRKRDASGMQTSVRSTLMALVYSLSSSD